MIALYTLYAALCLWIVTDWFIHAVTVIETGVEHDYTKSGWGHSVRQTNNDQITGFGEGIQPGDIILATHMSGKIGRWKVWLIDYMVDPPDQWFANAEFMGYKS